jgi:hypothetical protein
MSSLRSDHAREFGLKLSVLLLKIAERARDASGIGMPQGDFFL